MELVSSLVSGVRGAENGSARLYRRGTSTRAAYFSDFEGTIHPTSGTDLALDANGGAVVYVNELVDVEVLSSDGTSIRSTTEGQAAPTVEVRSLSFTGTDYTTGARAPGNPTTLQTVLDLWKTSAGEPDFNVLFNGSSETIQNALGSIAGIFINVKSPEFGAVGDGVTDDTTPIQNALNEAGSIGAIVFFPPGTYLTKSKLTVPASVSLWGSGPTNTSIQLDHASADTLEYGSGSVSIFDEIRNLSIFPFQTNSGKLISITNAGARWLKLTNCQVGQLLNTGVPISVASTNAHLQLDSCKVFTSNDSAAISSAINGAEVEARSTLFVALGPSFNGGLLNVRNFKATSCTFALDNISAGSYVAILISGDGAGTGPRASIVGCEFVPGSGTAGGIQMTNGNETTTSFYEAANTFQTGFVAAYAGLGAQSNSPQIQLDSRASQTNSITSNASPLNIPADQFGTTVLFRTNNAPQTVTAPVGHPGALWTLVLVNQAETSFSDSNITFGSGFVANSPAIPDGALPDTHFEVVKFQSVVVNGSGAWFPISYSVHDLG